MSDVPKLFVSYSHEESEHDKWVATLASDLRKNGVDASMDRWDLTPGQDTTLFMESQIRDSDLVLLICTPVYAEKSNIPRGGVGYEKNIISAEILQTRDLGPKFIPILRKGTHDNALPIYLGSKYAIDFRDDRNYKKSLGELLRATYKQPHPDKPPLGKSPFLRKTEVTDDVSTYIAFKKPYLLDIESWEKEVRGRFDFLCEEKISTKKQNPFALGYWQASFALCQEIRGLGLSEFLKILKDSETNRTGWDIGWVPTRSGIAPYPYKDGIEVWLAEDGGKKPGFSDFWRAEPAGRFSLFRGYQEDGGELPNVVPGKTLDFYLVLWRITEFLLYIESFAEKVGAKDSKAIMKISWNGLKGRRIGTHKSSIPLSHFATSDLYLCNQDEASSYYEIETCKNIKKKLIQDVNIITKSLFEIFRFFSVDEGAIKINIRKLFDADKEAV